jgi:bile acid-coenzyme A ligase
MTDTAVADSVSYGAQLTRLAAARGDDLAIVLAGGAGEETALTWGELEARANQVARRLEQSDVGQDDLVAIALPSSLEHLITTFAAWKLGAVVLPMRHDLPAWERERLLALASARAVVANWDEAPPGTLSTADVATTVELPSSALPDRVPKWSHVIASSGSTGAPKLIARPTPGVVVANPSVTVVTGGEEGQTFLGVSPLYHANGWQAAAGALVLGHRSILMARFDAALAVDLIRRHQVTTVIAVPTMLQRIVRLPAVSAADFTTVVRAVQGGAPLPEWVARAWFKLVPPERCLLAYGSSEGLGLIVATGEEWLERPGTTGRPANCDLRIQDADGRLVPAGTVGDIYLRSHNPGPPFVYLGVDTPAPTEDGFRTVGDLGWVDDDGYLFIADRREDLIVTGGANVFPAEVEAALGEHPGIADLVVIGLPDEEWGQRVHVIVEPVHPGSAPDAEELRAFCKDRLAAYKVPKSYELVDRLPRSDAGKLNRGLLARQRKESA